MKYSTKFGKIENYDLQVGGVYETDKPVTLYPRQADKERYKIENSIGFKILDINSSGRRINCEFYDASHTVIATRRVYREYVETLIDQLGLTVETVEETPAVDAVETVEATVAETQDA